MARSSNGGLSTPHSTNLSRTGSPLRPAFSAAASNGGGYSGPERQGVSGDLHPVIQPGRVAVITGGASGIGKAAAFELAKIGLKIAIADRNVEALTQVKQELAEIVGESNVLAVPTDVSDHAQVVKLKDVVYETWGEVAILMNNAGIGLSGTSWADLPNWHQIFSVNVFGIVNVQQVFVPSMLHQENQAMVINTGSKQGITNPPGNAAYNASKAAVKSLTEGLSYELRTRPHCNVTAHLFIPGWTYTPLVASSATAPKPAGAWTPEETVLYMLDKVREGVFYILVPDNETKRELDELRIMWAAGDVVEGRPALSRWHKDYKRLYEEYVKEGMEGR